MLYQKVVARLWRDYGALKVKVKPPKINDHRNAVLIALNSAVKDPLERYKRQVKPEAT